MGGPAGPGRGEPTRTRTGRPERERKGHLPGGSAERGRADDLTDDCSSRRRGRRRLGVGRPKLDLRLGAEAPRRLDALSASRLAGLGAESNRRCTIVVHVASNDRMAGLRLRLLRHRLLSITGHNYCGVALVGGQELHCPGKGVLAIVVRATTKKLPVAVHVLEVSYKSIYSTVKTKQRTVSKEPV